MTKRVALDPKKVPEIDEGMDTILKYGLPLPKELEKEKKRLPVLDFEKMTMEELERFDAALAILEDLQKGMKAREEARGGCS